LADLFCQFDFHAGLYFAAALTLLPLTFSILSLISMHFDIHTALAQLGIQNVLYLIKLKFIVSPYRKL